MVRAGLLIAMLLAIIGTASRAARAAGDWGDATVSASRPLFDDPQLRVGSEAQADEWLPTPLEPVATQDRGGLLDEMPLESPARVDRRGSGFGEATDRAPFRLRATWLPARPLKQGAGDLSLDVAEVALGAPLQIDDRGLWLALGGFERLGITSSAVFPQSGLALPDELWDIEFGVMRIRELDSGWRTGGMVRVGSPSDEPFGAWRDLTITLLGFVTIPSGERDAWNLSVFYSPTGQIVFPIPGIAYAWRPNDALRMNIGIPFAVEYQPNELWTISANYRPLYNVDCTVKRALGDVWSIYGAYRTVNKTYWLAERQEARERTYFFDQRLTLGLQCQLGPQWQVDLATSYVFDRQIFQAEKFSGPRRDELDIDPGMAATLSISWTR